MTEVDVVVQDEKQSGDFKFILKGDSLKDKMADIRERIRGALNLSVREPFSVHFH